MYFEKSPDLYKGLLKSGQNPRFAVVACSDSRVDPAIVLQTKPGDIFAVRNVAALVPPNEEGGQYHGTSAALEFAVTGLAVEHIIIIGHAHCGGIKALLNPPDVGTKGNFFVPSWMSIVESAYLRVMGTMPDASSQQKAQACEQGAVLVSLENLMTFPCIRENVGNGSLKLHGWYINIREGELSTYNAVTQTFERVE